MSKTCKSGCRIVYIILVLYNENRRLDNPVLCCPLDRRSIIPTTETVRNPSDSILFSNVPTTGFRHITELWTFLYFQWRLLECKITFIFHMSRVIRYFHLEVWLPFKSLDYSESNFNHNFQTSKTNHTLVWQYYEFETTEKCILVDVNDENSLELFIKKPSLTSWKKIYY